MKSFWKGIAGIPIFAVIVLTCPVWAPLFMLWKLGQMTYEDVECWWRNR